jgi:hypothetical protein
MNFKLPTLVSAVAVLMLSGPAYAQETPKYDYVEAFKPFFIHRWDRNPFCKRTARSCLLAEFSRLSFECKSE